VRDSLKGHHETTNLLAELGFDRGGCAVSGNLRAADAQSQAARESGGAIIVDPKPLFEISPHLYMQFMEPLGVTDSSVEASWDWNRDDWRKDFIDTTADLSPGIMRFGGLLSRYYKWREGVGPAAKRPPYRNYVWGGKESHRVARTSSRTSAVA